MKLNGLKIRILRQEIGGNIIMMMDNGNGTFTAGGLDVLCILHDVNTDKYHAAFFEEKPLPGKVKSIEETDIVRLKSKMHHTGGSDTLDGALEHLKELSEKIIVPGENVFNEPIEWDGTIGIVLLWKNWRKQS